jgi:hypothetical protein
MERTKLALLPRRRPSPGMEIRYERSFLLDLKKLDPQGFQQVCQFVFDEFPKITQLHELPSFQKLGSSGIFYRFTLAQYLISLEVTGQLVKFLRVLPKPDL